MISLLLGMLMMTNIIVDYDATEERIEEVSMGTYTITNIYTPATQEQKYEKVVRDEVIKILNEGSLLPPEPMRRKRERIEERVRTLLDGATYFKEKEEPGGFALPEFLALITTAMMGFLVFKKFGIGGLIIFLLILVIIVLVILKFKKGKAKR